MQITVQINTFRLMGACNSSPRLINGWESSAPTFYIKQTCTFHFSKFEQVRKSLNNFFQSVNTVHSFKIVKNRTSFTSLVRLPKMCFIFLLQEKIRSNLSNRNKTFKNGENTFVLSKRVPKNFPMRWIFVENGSILPSEKMYLFELLFAAFLVI